MYPGIPVCGSAWTSIVPVKSPKHGSTSVKVKFKASNTSKSLHTVIVSLFSQPFVLVIVTT